MKILSHRGYWRSVDEKNRLAAFERTLSHGFGTETDVRDRDGALVVAHDPGETGTLAWSDLIDMFSGSDMALAVNVKADGLAPLLLNAFEGRDVDWFAFDMSLPEMVRYLSLGVPFFSRHSDFEPTPSFYEQAQGVWLDAFETDWFDQDMIAGHLASGKRVCVVSPELHGRSYDSVWRMLSGFPLDTPGLMLCTDHPGIAAEFFSR